MEPTEQTTRDLMLAYAGRAFALRAYRDDTIAEGPQWRSLIFERRTPLACASNPSADPAACLAAAVRHLIEMIEARPPLPTPISGLGDDRRRS